MTATTRAQAAPGNAGEHARCIACRSEMPISELVHLHDLERPTGGPEHEVLLCTRCLDTRRSRVWTADDSRTRRLKEAMGGRHDRVHNRFSYLQDETKDIHLVRLRPHWVDGHLQPGSLDVAERP